MESPPFKTGQDGDRISTLPDELLIGILELLSVRDAVRAGTFSMRWRHLPHQLSRVDLNVDDFQGTTPLETMDSFTGAVCRLLSVSPPAESECQCDCKTKRAMKTICLHFYPSAPHLSSIGHAVEDTASRGKTQHLEFRVIPLSSDLIAADLTELGKKFMSFSRACPIAFRWLTSLSLKSLEFRESDDLPSLMAACNKLKHLSIISCGIGWHSVLKIDMPNSIITKLEFIHFRCTRIELVSVPMLTHLCCDSWHSKNSPLHFGYVPELREVNLSSHAAAWHVPFALSECFSMNTRNMSRLHLNFSCQMIWIQPEPPKQLSAIFPNLTYVALWCIFPECDLSWTLFILEAAPALQRFILHRPRHPCAKASKHSAEKTNVVWEPSKDLKHLKLKSLVMIGFEEEDKVANYIRLVTERATGLKIIVLHGHSCKACDAIECESTRSQVDKASRQRVRDLLTRGASSSVKIVFVDGYAQ